MMTTLQSHICSTRVEGVPLWQKRSSSSVSAISAIFHVVSQGGLGSQNWLLNGLDYSKNGSLAWEASFTPNFLTGPIKDDEGRNRVNIKSSGHLASYLLG